MSKTTERKNHNRPTVDLNLTHPEYREAVADGVGNRAGMWEKVLDCIEGEETVKEKGEAYLPKTSSMKNAAVNPEQIEAVSMAQSAGDEHYDHYRARADFPDWTNKAAEAMSGMLSRVAPTVELPDRLEPMRVCAMADGRDVFSLISAVLDRQIKSGRIGVLLDAPTEREKNPCPRALLYYELNILNWHCTYAEGIEKLDYVLLDESAPAFNPETFTYETQKRYRVLALDGRGDYYTIAITDKFDKFDILNPPAEALYPTISGQKLKEIPFVFFNANGNQSGICRPPLSGIANNALSAYRISADYRQSMYNCGQATLFIKGIPAKTRIAVGATTAITTDNDSADARWLEISGSGLQQMANRWAELKQESKELSVELVDNTSESGKALNTRLAVKTAPLVTIANACQAGMKRLLSIAAEWTRCDPNEIKIMLDTDFNDAELNMQELQIMGGMVDSGHMIERDYWQYLRDKRWTSTETYEEWKNEKSQTAMPDFVGMMNAEKTAQGAANGSGASNYTRQGANAQ